MNNLGRDKLDWKPEIWARIDKAVQEETQRTKVAAKFVPIYGPLDAELTVASDKIDPETGGVIESETLPIVEIWVEFPLTQQQVEHEADLSAAVTAATRAANSLSLAEDRLLFEGSSADLPKKLRVQRRPANVAGTG